MVSSNFPHLPLGSFLIPCIGGAVLVRSLLLEASARAVVRLTPRLLQDVWILSHLLLTGGYK